MPVSDDPQVQAQQKMMKYMMIMFCLFFYKVAAGLCIYFIAGSLWGIAERNFIPKPKKPEEGDPSFSSNQSSGKNGEPDEPKPLGWWGRRKALWREKWKDILQQAQKQSDHRQAQQDPSQGNADRTTGAGKKKKKKKR